MAIGDSKSTTTVRGDTDAIIDQAIADQAQVLELQNIEVSKKASLDLDFFAGEGANPFDFGGVNAKGGGRVTVNLTAPAAIAAAADALAGAQEIALRGVDASAGVLLAQLEQNANLLGDVGQVLGAGFESAVEFASTAATESNRIAAAIAGGAPLDALSGIGGSSSRNLALGVAALAVLVFGFVALKKG